jgi:hypothetical protein
MKDDVRIFFLVLAVVAIVGQIVRNPSGSTDIIGSFFNGAASLFGTTITGNPQFYSQAKGYAPSTQPSTLHTQTGYA